MAGLAFFTGFPGFIGKRLIRRLLSDDPELRVAAIVEESMVDRARKSAEDLGASDRIDVMQVDIGERDLVFLAPDLDELKQEATVPYPPAAIYNLAVPLSLAQRVNVE